MSDARGVLAHLLDCFDTTYRVLGEAAPRLENDAYVVRAYESARAFGEVALALRLQLGEARVASVPALDEVLSRSVADDPSGALTLYCVAAVVGPRLLVSLRDARASELLDDAQRFVLDGAAEVLVREVLAIGDVAQGDDVGEDESWQRHARELVDRLEESGNAESFGLSR